MSEKLLVGGETLNLEAQVKKVGELRCLLGSGLTKGGVTVSITATVERTSLHIAIVGRRKCSNLYGLGLLSMKRSRL